jgi:hypothetical protein
MQCSVETSGNRVRRPGKIGDHVMDPTRLEPPPAPAPDEARGPPWRAGARRVTADTLTLDANATCTWRILLLLASGIPSRDAPARQRGHGANCHTVNGNVQLWCKGGGAPQVG